MSDLIQLVRIWDQGHGDTWWTRTVDTDARPDTDDRVILWGTHETWLSVPFGVVERRNWLSDGTLAITLKELGSPFVNAVGGADAAYEKMRQAGWVKIDA